MVDATNKINALLKNIDAIIKAEEDDDITDVVPEFPGIDKIPKYIDDYESKVAKLLRTQRKHFMNGVKEYIGKDITLEGLLVYVTGDLFAADQFAEDMEEETKEFLTLTISELAEVIMDAVDKDVPFEVLSDRTVKWIEDWAFDLSQLMKLNTHRSIEDALKNVISEGGSIQDAELAMKDLPQFDRYRARTTAITEILTASSRSQWEAYQQSPAVTKKQWKHSGSKKNNARENHVDMDGLEVNVEDDFTISGTSLTCQYPRDPDLPASERVRCHCVMGPVVDQDVIGLSKEEKEQLRQEALAELDG